MCCESQTIISLRASSLRRCGQRRGRKRKESLQPRLWNLNSTSNSIPCGSPSTELSDFRQSARSENERKMLTNIEKHVPRVMTSLLMSSLPINISHRIFRWSFSNSRKVHVRVVASSPSFSRLAARAPRRGCSQARELSIVWLTYPKHSFNIKFQYFLLS